MNKRIRQLADQALCIKGGELTFNGGEVELVDLEKFAELMVFECVNAVMDGTKEGDHYAQRIEQHFDNGPGGILHFGVEE